MSHEHRSPAVPQSIAQRESALLAPYATPSISTAGRRHAEDPPHRRGPYEIDRDRIIHSAAFRRLSAKTQVFTGEMGDYHRTRLTHTLEVVAVARRLGRALRLNEDLIEALALAHDLGHPPFGHAGEDALDECLHGAGGFCHNRHALRILEVLEACNPKFEGLNLSREVLDGQHTRIDHDCAAQGISLEAQVVEAADSVAYDTHDADDAMKLGFVTLEEMLEVPLWRTAARHVRTRYANLSEIELKRAVLVELVDWQLDDLIARTEERLAEGERTRDWVLRQREPLIAASPKIAAEKAAVERFLHERVYRHPQVLVMRGRAQSSLREMFAVLRGAPEQMPESFRARIATDGLDRAVGDYLAGMTDRFTQQQYARLCGTAAGGGSRSTTSKGELRVVSPRTRAG
ncbi:MAG: dNTP triphosphohydrolase [Pirellulales bacterium]|nr:dNTP triphosphohydrolase [Pirellulales bacterium]